MTTTRDALTLDEQVCFAMVVANRAVLSVYRPILEPMGLTHPQYLVMLALWQHAPVTVKRLSELLVLEPATLSPLLKRLEHAGLVERRRSTEDERQLAVTVTPQGRALRDRALQVPPAVVERLGMTLDELSQLRALLGRVTRAAEGDSR
jgi:DNA-binding MarR family transcriptional regulator